MNIVALVVGATGIAGRGACQELIRCGAEVHGLSRNPAGLVPSVHHVTALPRPSAVTTCCIDTPCDFMRTTSRLTSYCLMKPPKLTMSATPGVMRR